jgi:nucleoside triphosphate pyrophosphatase
LLGREWRVAAADIDEDALLTAEPITAAVSVALAKMRATPASEDEVVIAADTLVVIDDDILAKPRTDEEARTMLERLRGCRHQVLTGVVLQRVQRLWAGVVSTDVMMRDYSGEEVEQYINRGEPFDKAGGYAIQDKLFRPVERLNGCYLNVVGLPLCAVAAGLNALGVPTRAAGVPTCSYCKSGEQLVRSGS